MTDTRTLLLIDNNPAHREALREALVNAKEGPFHGEWVRTLSQGVKRLREGKIWAIFASLALPDSQGLDTIDKLLQVSPGVPILVMGGAADEDLSTEALRRGAKDYLLNGHIGTYSFGRAIRNMAERKTAEEVLFIEKERATVTLNSIGDAVLSTDMVGNVTYLNVVAEKITGWQCVEALGRPLGEVFHIVNGTTRRPRNSAQEIARLTSIDEDSRQGAREINLPRKGVPSNELDDCPRVAHEPESFVCQAAIRKSPSFPRKSRGIQAILRFLRLQRVYVSSPMHDRDGTLIFRVGDFVFTDTQLIRLMAKKQPNR
jgi:PAS domain-containing protein